MTSTVTRTGHQNTWEVLIAGVFVELCPKKLEVMQIFYKKLEVMQIFYSAIRAITHTARSQMSLEISVLAF